jgi:hypothetical protein
VADVQEAHLIKTLELQGKPPESRPAMAASAPRTASIM